MSRLRLQQAFTALLILVALLCQQTWALAGTTGGINGVVRDETGAPVANAKVTATATSQTVTIVTDASGHYTFLSLAPDTYSVSVVKEGYEPTTQAGITVFADNNVNVNITVKKSLRTIANVTSRAASSLVKPGTTSDVYSVNSATAAAVAAVGGGNNLNSAYSALATQPGVTLGYGGIGWGQTVYIHGSSYSQVGYEFDGVPVNRAFDNYNANSLSNLGQQELQVATGGSQASSVSATVGGFINQVIRTGTYPGFGGLEGGLGSPTYYHQGKAEAGGASPNRLFSYYVGVLGSNQDLRPWDNFNGGSFLPNLMPAYSTFTTVNVQGAGIFPYCNPDGSDPARAPGVVDSGCVGGPFPLWLGSTSTYSDREAIVNLHFGIPHKNDTGRDDIQLLYDGSFQQQYCRCSINDYGGYNYVNTQLLGGTAGPAPANFIPYKDTTIFAPGTNFGTIVAPGTSPPTINYFFPSSPTNRLPNSQLNYNQQDGQNNDAQIWKLQYQKNIGSNSYIRLYGYTFYSDWLLNSPTFASLAYNFGNFLVAPFAGDYELITHTAGGSLSYANQIDPKNLLNFDINYTRATVSRFNNSTFRANPNYGGTSLENVTGTGIISVATNLVQTNATGNPIMDGAHCIDFNTGLVSSCFNRGTFGTFGDPTRSTYCSTHTCTIPANSKWVVTNTGPAGTLNKVTPKFTSSSLTDQFRPTDKLLINLGLRWDQFEYDLTPMNAPVYNFWFGAAANSFCYDPANANAPVTAAQSPPIIPLNNPLFIGATCPASPVSGLTTLHPNGTVQSGQQSLLYSNNIGSTYTVARLLPRFSGTYTLNPDNVVRFSLGQYLNPFNTATVQYDDASPARAADFDYTAFWSTGFQTPEHQVQPSFSTNADLSWEHHLKGTDMSLKVSPFYRYVRNQTQDSFIGTGFVSAIPTNNESAYGLEFQFNVGDPNRNGLSGQLSATWTRAFSKFNQIGSTGQNFIDTINGEVALYNGLTKAASGTSYTTSGGKTIRLGTAAPCYLAGAPDTADCTVSGSSITMSPAGLAAGAVINPYFFAAPQAYYNPGAPYPLYQTFPNYNEAPTDFNMTIVWPYVFSGFVSYKHDKFTITPNFQLIDGFSGGASGGGSYGSPLSVPGVDPRGCSGNQGQAGVTTVNPGLPNYLTCGGSPGPNGLFYIPNPYTGAFDGFGAYSNPWLLNFNVQLKYEVNRRITVNAIFANVYNKCFGGSSQPWTNAAPPSRTNCGYAAGGGYNNPIFAGGLTQAPGTGFFVGKSPTDPANGKSFSPGVFYPYVPVNNVALSAPTLPFQMYFNVQIRL
ncbi:MAG: carboxypeptidase regulatory-like domain-containing protein [Vulcanimicrobiaceae bacterium]